MKRYIFIVAPHESKWLVIRVKPDGLGGSTFCECTDEQNAIHAAMLLNDDEARRPQRRPRPAVHK